MTLSSRQSLGVKGVGVEYVGLGGQVILLITADSEGHSDFVVQGKDVKV